MTSRGTRVALGVWTALVIAFLWFPLMIIVLFAFNASQIQTWPISDWSTHWFSVAWHDEAVRTSLWLSVKIGLAATAIALVLGTMASFAIHRFRFFGRESVSFVLLLPIALPGIITGMALNSFFSFAGVSFSIWTIVVGHATFCVVVVYNNAVARFRRTSGSLIEASMDLGADGFQTFRHVILPNIGTALLAGGMLAFALSFDEVIVTTFTAGQQQTLPIWMLEELVRPRQRPVTNVVAMVVVLVTLLPILAAYYLTRDGDQIAGAGK
jgi:putative spermidine/putrescine transport system permease protein